MLAVESFSYEVNHGVSPNVATITTYPQKAIPQEFGDLSWTDGTGDILTIAGRRAKKQQGQYSLAGQTWVLTILDPRWQWMNEFGGLSGITGHYNDKDDRGELKPWTIRSAEELIILCLTQLGVTNYRIRAPQGYRKIDGARLNRILFLGERFPPSGTNLEFIWDHTPPAEALTQICQQYGLRLVYQPFSNLVIITPPGEGRPLPDGPIEMSAPNISVPETPVAVAAYGAEVRIQCRLPLESVGKEWHGWPVNPNDLSYAPQITAAPGKPQKSKIHWVVPTPPPSPLGISLTFTDVDGREVRIDVESSVSTSVADLYADLILKLSEYASVPALFTLAVSGNDILINSTQPNAPFGIQLFKPGEPDLPMNEFAQTIEQVATGPVGAATWSYSNPSLFPNVRPTDRLSFMEARRLAQESVYKWFRVKMADGSIGSKTGVSQTSTSANGSAMPPPPTIPKATPSQTSTSAGFGFGFTDEPVPKPEPKGKQPGLWIPWYSEQYGFLTRREQLIILPTKVEQVTPKPRVGGIKDKGNPLAANDPTGKPISSQGLPEAYTGVSRDQEATVTGSVYHMLGNVNWYRFVATDLGVGNNATAVPNQNTASRDRVFIPFSIIKAVNGEQLIGFSEVVYRYLADSQGMATSDFPDLTLETSVIVKHPLSSMPIRWEEFLAIPGGISPIEWHPNDELSVGVVGVYDANNNLMGWRYADGDIAYTKQAAQNFLSGKAARYYVKGGETRQYPGIINIEPDGFIQQVSWTIGPGGSTTIASTNSEHSPWWPRYPQRVRAELLAPNKLAAEANARERAHIDSLNPRTVTATQ